MPKRSSKPRDLNAMAAAIVDEATSDKDGEEPEGNDRQATEAAAKDDARRRT